MRRRGRTDANHAAIVQALRQVGASVTSLADVGHGVPDLLVSYRGDWHVLELKDGSKAPSDQQVTMAEVRWAAEQHAPVHLVRSLEEALRAIGASR